MKGKIKPDGGKVPARRAPKNTQKNTKAKSVKAAASDTMDTSPTSTMESGEHEF